MASVDKWFQYNTATAFQCSWPCSFCHDVVGQNLCIVISSLLCINCWITFSNTNIARTPLQGGLIDLTSRIQQGTWSCTFVPYCSEDPSDQESVQSGGFPVKMTVFVPLLVHNNRTRIQTCTRQLSCHRPQFYHVTLDLIFQSNTVRVYIWLTNIVTIRYIRLSK